MSRAFKPSEAGWPRPWCDYTPEDVGGYLLPTETRRLPAPWVGGDAVLENDWVDFRKDASRAHVERLCAVCGERMDGLIVLGRQHHKDTNGPGCHPRCAAMAVKFCPHFEREFENVLPYGPCDIGHADAIVAYVYDGPGVGYCHRLTDTDGLYTNNLKIKANARPLDRAALRELASRDPLGIAA